MQRGGAGSDLPSHAEHIEVVEEDLMSGTDPPGHTHTKISISEKRVPIQGLRLIDSTAQRGYV